MVDGRDPPLPLNHTLWNIYINLFLNGVVYELHIIVHVIFLFYLMVYADQKRSEYLHHVIAQD